MLDILLSCSSYSELGFPVDFLSSCSSCSEHFEPAWVSCLLAAVAAKMLGPLGFLSSCSSCSENVRPVGFPVVTHFGNGPASPALIWERCFHPALFIRGHENRIDAHVLEFPLPLDAHKVIVVAPCDLGGLLFVDC